MTVFLVLLSLTLCFFGAYGHRYLETEGKGGRNNPVPVTDHQISWAAYGKISEAGEIDYYRFEAKRDEEIYASIVIPKLERLRDFAPEFALIGPGLHEVESPPNDADRFLDVRENEGVMVSRYGAGEESVFFEPFTQTSYYERQELRIDAPETGTYHVAVYHPDGATGKYVLAIGEKEVFGPKDILGLPATWWKVRIFAEQKLSTYLIAGGVIGGLAVGSFFLVRALI